MGISRRVVEEALVLRLRGFDRLNERLSERRQVLWSDEQFDGAGLAGTSLD